MRYILTREELKQSKNPYIHRESLIERDFFVPKYDYLDPYQQVKKDGTGRGLSFAGVKFKDQVDGEQLTPGGEGEKIVRKMEALFPEDPTGVAMAYSQNLLAAPTKFVLSPDRFISSPIKGSAIARPEHSIFRRQNLFNENDQYFLEVTSEQFPIVNFNDIQACKYVIPGTIKCYYRYDKVRKEFQLERVEASNRLLRKMIMEDVGELKAEDIFNEGVFEDELGLMQETFIYSLDSFNTHSFNAALKNECAEFSRLIDEIPDLELDLKNKIIRTVDRYIENLQILEGVSNQLESSYIEHAEGFKRKFDRIMASLRKTTATLQNAEALEKCLMRLQVKSTQPLINRAIKNIADNGINLKDAPSKKEKSDELVKALITDSKVFYESSEFTQRNVSRFVQEFSRKIENREKELNIPRHLWKPIVLNVAVAITGLGIFLILGKAFYATFINQKASPYLFKTTSCRQAETAKEVVGTLPKMIGFTATEA